MKKYNKQEKKVMMITGASRGLGRYLCQFFAKAGLKIAAIARNKDDLEELAKSIISDNPDNIINCYAVDVRDYEGLENAVADINGQWGTIDILVNNAGCVANKSFLEHTKQDIDDTIDVNLKGVIYPTRIVTPIMIKNKNGHIINISSTSGLRGLKEYGIYAASKHGVNGFADSMSKYLIEHNILVTTLCPGGINTTWWDRMNWPFEKEMLIEPKEIAELIRLIISSPASTLYKQVTFFPVCEADLW